MLEKTLITKVNVPKLHLITGNQLHRGFRRLAIVFALMPLLVGGVVLLVLSGDPILETKNIAPYLVLLSLSFYLMLRAVGSGLFLLCEPGALSAKRQHVAGFFGFWSAHVSILLLLKLISGGLVADFLTVAITTLLFVPIIVVMVYVIVAMRSAFLKLFGQVQFLSGFSASTLIKMLAVFFAVGWFCVGVFGVVWGLNQDEASMVTNGLFVAIGAPLVALALAKVVIWVLNGFEGVADLSSKQEWVPNKRVLLVAILLNLVLIIGVYRMIAGPSWKFPECRPSITVEADSQLAAENAWRAKVKEEYGEVFANSGIKIMSRSVRLNGKYKFSAQPCIKVN